MSDFGTFITATKKDGLHFTDTDISALSAKLRTILKADKYMNSLSEDFNDRFEKESGGPSVIVLLSEHYYGGEAEENGEMFSFVKDTELHQAEEIAMALGKAFPDYELTAETDEF